MSFLDKVVIGLAAVVLITMAALIFMIPWGGSVRLILAILTGFSLELALAGLLLGLVGIYLLFLITRPAETAHAVIHHSELGDVHISLSSIKELVIRVCSQIEGIRNVHVELPQKDPVKVQVRLEVLPDFRLPELLEKVQTQIREYLQETVGVNVETVEVLVRGIAGEPQSPTE